MAETETRIAVRCPKCGSEDIRERNVAYAELRVLAWRLDGDGVIPDEYDADESADWEVEDRDDQYVCHSCGKRLNIGDLTGVEVPDA